MARSKNRAPSQDLTHTPIHLIPARSGAVEPIAAGLFAWLALSSRRAEHSLCGQLALSLLGLRLLWAGWLLIITARDWRRYHAPAVLALPTVHEIMARPCSSTSKSSGGATAIIQITQRSSGSARICLLLGFLPFNVELLQWVRWRSAPHDGLPNHGLVAITAALSLSHGISLLLLQGWFLATGGIESTEYDRAAALGGVAALSIGALCRVGVRRALLLYRLPSRPIPSVDVGVREASKRTRPDTASSESRTETDRTLADAGRFELNFESCSRADTTVSMPPVPRLIAQLSGEEREAARSASLQRQAAARARMTGSQPSRAAVPATANAAAILRARERVRRMAAEAAQQQPGVPSSVAANAAALERARGAQRLTAEEAVRQLEEEDTLGYCQKTAIARSSGILSVAMPAGDGGGHGHPAGSSADGALSSSLGAPESHPVLELIFPHEVATDPKPIRRTAAPLVDDAAATATAGVAASRVTRAKQSNLARRVGKRISRARAANQEVRERVAEQTNIGEAAVAMIEQWRPASLPAPNTPTTPRSTAAASACAVQRLQVARASNRIRRSRAASSAGGVVGGGALGGDSQQV